MPLEKQSLNNFLPNGFETLNQEGYKENFSEDKIATGYEKDVPDIVSGPNLNNLIDVVGKNTNTLNNYVEYLNGMPINNVPTTDENGQLNYINLDDKLTKKQITNCILEIPQRIKYTLENGTLTIKAGSVVIVPYGVEDLTSQYPKGATFIHDNFKVYDTQYEDGKFFVWMELTTDIIRNGFGSGSSDVLFYVDNDSTGANDIGVTSYHYSGETAPTQSGSIWYDTVTNLVKANGSGSWLSPNTLPLGVLTRTDGVANSVTQVFNGMGYIGSTVWVDKGIKGLIPNGRNEDGTLRNIEYITNFMLYTKKGGNITNVNSFYFGSSNLEKFSYCQQDFNFVANTMSEAIKIHNQNKNASIIIYVIDENKIFISYPDTNFTLTEISVITGVFEVLFDEKYNVVKFAPIKKNVSLADCTQVSGQWVTKIIYLAENITLTNNTGALRYDLSDYLPNDGFDYDVKFAATITTGAASGNYIHLYLRSDILPYNTGVCGTRTRSNSEMSSVGSADLPIGQKRYIEVADVSSANANGKFSLNAYAYRRIGKNI